MKNCPVCTKSYKTDALFCPFDGTALVEALSVNADSQTQTYPDNSNRVIGGKYRLERLLGSGGMGEVHLARHLDCNYQLAIKLLYKYQKVTPDVIERFRREAQIASSIKHPNTVWVFDFGEEPDFFFLAMEYVKGNTLRDVLVKLRHITEPGKLANYCRQMGAALTELHGSNIVHRDLKPENVMITTVDEVESLRVLDFGIAYAMDALRLTPPGGGAGTLPYMSPEQLNGKATPRTDIYAMAAIFYELVTGNWIYATQPLTELKITQAEVVNKILYEDPVRLDESIAHLPAGLSEVLFRGLAKNPESRQSNVNDFVNEFLNAWKITTDPVRNQKLNVSQLDIFLSVAKEDYSTAMEIAEKLRAENITVGLNPPEDYEFFEGFSDIAGKIASAKLVALLCSDAALRSRLVKQTVQIAWKYDKPCLPVQVAPVSYSEQLDYWLDGQKTIRVFEGSVKSWLSELVARIKPQSKSAFRGLGAPQTSVVNLTQKKARDLASLRRMASFTDQIWVTPANVNQSRQPTAVFRGLGAAQPAAIQKICVGDSVRLVVELDQTGYLLLLNEGADNTVYCLCPSLFAPNDRLTPGQHIFPQSNSRYDSFVITGNSGREKLLAIITDEPLGLGWMTRDPNEPAKVLSEDDKNILISALRNLDVRVWTALATYFDVSM